MTWNRTLYPLPTPAINIHQMYTLQVVPDTKKAIPPSTDSENDRKQFESSLQNYHLTHDSEASRLAGFVFAASAAIACERLSEEATMAGISFPVEAAGSSLATFSTASVVLARIGSSPTLLLRLLPAFTVPAVFFYVLGTGYPSQVSVQQRYSVANMATEDQLRSQFQTAVDSGILALPAGPVGAGDTTPTTPWSLNLDRAARRLTALGSTSIGPQCPTASLLQGNTQPSGISSPILGDWLQYSGLTADIDANFWAPAISNYPAAYTTLLLQAITQGDTQLVAQIQVQFKVTTVQQLVALKSADWLAFFTSHEALLPDFTLPGNPQQRTDSFVQRVQKFFAVPTDTVGFSLPDNGQVSSFSASTDDITEARTGLTAKRMESRSRIKESRNQGTLVL
jgi:hypothetical protein